MYSERGAIIAWTLWLSSCVCPIFSACSFDYFFFSSCSIFLNSSFDWSFPNYVGFMNEKSVSLVEFIIETGYNFFEGGFYSVQDKLIVLKLENFCFFDKHAWITYFFRSSCPKIEKIVCFWCRKFFLVFIFLISFLFSYPSTEYNWAQSIHRITLKSISDF